MVRGSETAEAEALARQLDVSPVLAALLVQRGHDSPERARAFLEADLGALHDPFLMRDMARAVDLLLEARQAEHPVFVHGDYDVDGVCSTALLTEGLRNLGFSVLHHVPDRRTEGYGVSLAAVERAAGQGARLLLTADCGSSSHRALARAAELGMTVIVSDHHRLPDELPRPDAFLNPQLADCPYPNKNLCGTGVAYKILEALHACEGLDAPRAFLDLVAVATIADVVPLVEENRALTRAGLELLARWDRPGLRALAQVAGIADGGPVGAWGVAFSLAPRINAAGRLEHAALALELVLSQDLDFCLERAQQLDEMNRRRQDVERTIREAVERRLQAIPERLDASVIVEGGDGWHPGVIGITAARLVEAYARPAFVISIEGEVAKGSARSPETVDLFEAMQACADLFEKFGGHARAGGFTLPASRIDELRDRLDQAVRRLRREEAVPVHADLALPLEQADLRLARELSRLEPIGEGNPRPLFLAHRVRLEELQTIGKTGDHLRWLACQGSARVKAVGFRLAGLLPDLAPRELAYDLLYHLEEDSWQGVSRPSLVVEGILAPDPAVRGALRREDPVPHSDLLDMRCVLDRQAALQRLLEGYESVLLVASSSEQARQARDVLQRLGASPPLVTLQQLDQADPAEAVVLLGPPPVPAAFDHPVLRDAARLVLLFGEREVEREASRQDALALDRQRMAVIWRALERVAREGRVSQADLGRLPVPESCARPETIRAALAVFEELGLVAWEADSPEGRTIRLHGGTGRKLEESRRFRELTRRRQEFQRLRRVLHGGRLSRAQLSQGA
ncbi:MAG: single-stranded-DNA-specific exonuclease RecJ [Candidatus Eremiobacterota bacterium]